MLSTEAGYTKSCEPFGPELLGRAEHFLVLLPTSDQQTLMRGTTKGQTGVVCQIKALSARSLTVFG